MGNGVLAWQNETLLGSPRNRLPDSRRQGQFGPLDELETLYLIRRSEMIRFLIRSGVDLVEAEDILQEVFLNAFDLRKPQKRQENLFYWTLKCARNLAITRYRRGKKEILAPAEQWKDWEATLADTSVGPYESAEQRDRELNMARATAQLSPVEQQCLLLRSRGITFREVANALDISMQSAVYTSDVAIKKLQRKLHAAKQ